jgi:hypothetical protein
VATPQPIPANLYSLAGHGVGVTLAPGLTGQDQLSYHDTHHEIQFTGDEIEHTDTRLGEMVTVFLRRSIDAGSTTFSLLVPRVELAGGGSAHVSTLGITTVHQFSIIRAANLGQRDLYNVVRLNGTASFIET